MNRKLLLGCGIASSILYIATDVIAARRYPGYSARDQVFSELFATDSPTRPLMAKAIGIPYTLLVSAFGVGVGHCTSHVRAARAARAAGRLLVGYAVAGAIGGLVFPMNTRSKVATRRNIMHIPATAVMSACVTAAMVVATRLRGELFRRYTYATIAALILFGVLTSLQGGRISANKPSPWAGAEERVNIYATMLWIAVLAIALWRA